MIIASLEVITVLLFVIILKFIFYSLLEVLFRYLIALFLIWRKNLNAFFRLKSLAGFDAILNR
jgi:hypothetical protein